MKYNTFLLTTLMIFSSSVATIDCSAPAHWNENSINRALDFWSAYSIDGTDNMGHTPLTWCIEKGKKSLARSVLAKGANPNVRYSHTHGWPALSMAAFYNRPGIVQDLLDYRANVNALSNIGWSALHTAILKKRASMLDALLAHGADVNLPGLGGDTPLHIAVEENYHDAVTKLLRRGAHVNAQNEKGETPLMFAANNNNRPITQTLLDNGADSAICDYEGSNSIHIARRKGNYSIERILQHKYSRPTDTTRPRDSNQNLFDAIYWGNINDIRDALAHQASLSALSSSGDTPLIYAIKKNRTTVVQELLARGALVNAQDRSGKSPLFHAIDMNNTHVIAALLDRGGYINEVDRSSGVTPLKYALKKRQHASFQLLLNRGADVSIGAPLIYTVKYNLDNRTQELLDRGANPNIHSHSGNTPLIWATKKGNRTNVRRLLDRGSLVNDTDNNGDTALNHAIYNHHYQIIDILMQYGGTINARTQKKRSTLLNDSIITGHERLSMMLIEKSSDLDRGRPLFYAIKYKRNTLVQELLKHGAHATIIDTQGNNGLHYAVGANSCTLARLLIAHGTPVDQLNNSGITPLKKALANGYTTTVNLLLDAGASITVGTPLVHAAAHNKNEMVQLLLTRGANVNESDSKGNTALLHATKQNNYSMATQLLAQGAHVNVINNDGKTPLIHATKHNNKNMMTALIKQGAYTYDAVVVSIDTNNLTGMLQLLELGAPINEQDKSGKTVLMHALQHLKQTYKKPWAITECLSSFASWLTGKTKQPPITHQIVFELLKHGANVDVVDNTGNSSLMHAIKTDDDIVVEQVAQKSKALNIKNNEGQTATSLAAQSKNKKIRGLFKSKK